MSRIVDPGKIADIKNAVMEVLVEKGFADISISEISEKSGVSPGYLYRYYNSKDDLVRELVDSELNRIVKMFILDIESSESVYEAAYKTISRLFLKANEDLLKAKFTAMVVMDLKLPTNEQQDNYESFIELADKCIKLGLKTGEIGSNITPTEVLIIAFSIPFRYLSFSVVLDSSKIFTDEDAKKIAGICVNALK